MWEWINQAGSYPRIVEATLRRALGGEAPLTQVLRLDADFSRGSMFRHLTYAVVSPSASVQIRVDEFEGEKADIATSIHPLSYFGSAVTLEFLADPETGGAIKELTLIVNMQGTRRLEIEPTHCEGPNCLADRDHPAASFLDGLTMRIPVVADRAETLEEAKRFAEVLSSMLRENK